MAIDFTQFIGNDPANVLNLEALVAALTKLTPPPEVFNPVDPAQFRGQAESEANPFFEKDLQLAMKEIETARAQAKAQKELAQKFQAQQEEQFFRVEDKSFANALQKAQGGFAGRGTFTSGIRDRAIGEDLLGRQEGLIEAQRGFAESTETRNQGFEQFLERSNLTEERARLENARAREGEIISRQGQIANQVSSQNQQIVSNFDRDFNRAVSFTDFLRQKSGA